jgi:hypothetical protein
MIEILTRKGPITKWTKWFSARPEKRDVLRLVQYNQCAHLEPAKGFRRLDFHTIVVALGQSEDALLGQCGKNTRYKINRARREGVCFALEKDLHHFAEFFITFACQKSLSSLTDTQLKALAPYLHVTKARLDGDDLVMHSYLVDKKLGRARLLHSASHFRQKNETYPRNFIGRANRYLHFEDMLHFKNLGLELYDFGGYAKNTQDPDLQQINSFKEGFGGSIVQESQYLSTPLYCLKKLSGSEI